MGAFSALKRIIMGAALGMGFLARLDLSTMSRHTERFDAGEDLSVFIVVDVSFVSPKHNGRD